MATLEEWRSTLELWCIAFLLHYFASRSNSIGSSLNVWYAIGLSSINSNSESHVSRVMFDSR